jgi:hypothetical protein
VIVGIVFCSRLFPALAQEPIASPAPVVEMPSAKPSSSPVPANASAISINGTDLHLRSVAPRSLNAMRMHQASQPDEAAVRCGFFEACVMGLTRGFSVGGDWMGGVSSLLLQPQIKAGGWLLADVFGGYQFLAEQNFYANGRIGYRHLRYSDSNGNTVSGRSLTLGFNYSQDVFPAYTQGLSFEGALSSSFSLTEKDRFYEATGPGENTRRAVNSFYGYSHRHPVLRVGFPADFEIINWKASHIDLPSDLRGYAHIEPYFAQNQFALSNDFLWVERNFGLRFGGSLAYESRPDRVAHRFAAQIKAGFDFATVSRNPTVESSRPDLSFDLPSRHAISVYADAVLSWQF